MNEDKEIKLIALLVGGCAIIAAAVLLIISLHKIKTVDNASLSFSEITECPSPKGYSCTIYNANGNIVDSYEHEYYDVEFEGVFPERIDNSFSAWTSGMEDDMTYSLGYLSDTTQNDYSEYVLIITNPEDDNKFVSAGIQKKDSYTLYQFFY